MIRHSLFTSSFRGLLKRLAGIGFIFILFLTLSRGLNFLYLEDDERARIMWHNFYEQEENIDYICVGSSHVYSAVNPELLDQRTGKNYYNMSTGGQGLKESYHIIKEASHRNRLKGVYLELYFVPSIEGQGDYDEFGAISNGWKNLDYRKFSIDKLDYFFDLNTPEYYISGALPFTRYREHLFNVEWIYSMQKNKKRPEYRNYLYGWESENARTEYTKKGYYYHTQEMGNAFLHAEGVPDDMRMTQDAEEYLRKILEYCRKEGIEITLFQAPVYKLEIMAYENYDDYTAGIKAIAEEYGVPYYDFNLVKDEYFPIQNMKYFVDTGHLNADGAEAFTNFLYEMTTKTPAQNEILFHQSFKEKLLSEKAQVTGIYYHSGTAEEIERGDLTADMYRMTIASNRTDELEYQIYLTQEGSDTVMIQDFSENKCFNIPMEEHGVCRIAWREKGDMENRMEMEVGY